MPGPLPKSEPAPAGRAWLFDLATASTLLAALLYASGWTYAYHYFAHFKLGLLMLEIPTRHYFMYGLWVFKAWWWLWAALYGLLVLAMVLWKRYARPSWQGLARRPLLSRQLQAGLVLLAFSLGWWTASTQAQRYYLDQSRSGFDAYPHVRIWPKGPPPRDDRLRRLYAALPEGEYRLLLQNSGKLFLFRVPEDGRPAHLAVVELALTQVEALRVLP